MSSQKIHLLSAICRHSTSRSPIGTPAAAPRVAGVGDRPSQRQFPPALPIVPSRYQPPGPYRLRPCASRRCPSRRRRQRRNPATAAEQRPIATSVAEDVAERADEERLVPVESTDGRDQMRDAPHPTLPGSRPWIGVPHPLQTTDKPSPINRLRPANRPRRGNATMTAGDADRRPRSRTHRLVRPSNVDRPGPTRFRRSAQLAAVCLRLEPAHVVRSKRSGRPQNLRHEPRLAKTCPRSQGRDKGRMPGPARRSSGVCRRNGSRRARLRRWSRWVHGRSRPSRLPPQPLRPNDLAAQLVWTARSGPLAGLAAEGMQHASKHRRPPPVDVPAAYPSP